MFVCLIRPCKSILQSRTVKMSRCGGLPTASWESSTQCCPLVPVNRLERVEKFLSKIYWSDINVTGIEYERRSQAAVTMTSCSPTEVRPPMALVLGTPFD